MCPAHGIRTGDSCRLNKGRSSKFRVGSRVRRTPEEGPRICQPKRYGNDNKDEDNSLKIFGGISRIEFVIIYKFIFLRFSRININTY